MRRELRLGELVVKTYKQPAVCQTTLLATFEEEGWPGRIDDPLPVVPGLDPKRRLHTAINGLNRAQLRPLIRFFGDGTGQGICWELRPPAAAP